MAVSATIAAAFAHLQAGDAAAALEASRSAARDEPANARAPLAAGIALRMLGRLPEAQAALELAASLDTRDYAIAYESAVVAQLRGDEAGALAQFRRAAVLRPNFFAAPFSAGLLEFARRDWASAIASFRAALAIDPVNADALANLGQALCERGDAADGEAAIARALSLAPAHAAARHAMGWALHRRGATAEAVEHFRAAAEANPRDPDWQLSHAKALGDLGRHAQAEEAYVRALSADPGHGLTLKTFGQYSVSRGNYARGAKLFAEAARGDPADPELPMFLAQVELLLGHWESAWSAYSKRDARRLFEHALSETGGAYRVPGLAETAGRDVILVAEQGLGDILFFLRFAPALKAAGARLHLAGEPRLHGLIARSGVIDSFHRDLAHASIPGSMLVLVADLPALVAKDSEPFAASLRIAPDASRLAKWTAALQAMGPRPWIGVTWRAGTAREQVAHALYKAVPVDRLFTALAALGGTVFAIQRGIEPGELDAASRALGSSVHDLSAANDDLEDMLALTALLDRHVGVSNTNMHLAAAAGAGADVLVPFPPEWRWRSAGASPWFPGFRVHRQSIDGDWAAALGELRG